MHLAMSAEDLEFEELLPLELKVRLLESELERLDSDLEWMQERRSEIQEEIGYYTKLLSKSRHRKNLRLVK